MKTVNEWIRYGIERKLGLTHVTMEELDKQVESKLCSSFMELRKNRLKLGYLRYEMYGKNKDYDALSSAISRLQRYQITGNRELLVDAANLIEIEWIRPIHKNSHWSTEDDGEHVKESG